MRVQDRLHGEMNALVKDLAEAFQRPVPEMSTLLADMVDPSNMCQLTSSGLLSGRVACELQQCVAPTSSQHGSRLTTLVWRRFEEELKGTTGAEASPDLEEPVGAIQQRRAELDACSSTVLRVDFENPGHSDCTAGVAAPPNCSTRPS